MSRQQRPAIDLRRATRLCPCASDVPWRSAPWGALRCLLPQRRWLQAQAPLQQWPQQPAQAALLGPCPHRGPRLCTRPITVTLLNTVVFAAGVTLMRRHCGSGTSSALPAAPLQDNLITCCQRVQCTSHTQGHSDQYSLCSLA